MSIENQILKRNAYLEIIKWAGRKLRARQNLLAKQYKFATAAELTPVLKSDYWVQVYEIALIETKKALAKHNEHYPIPRVYRGY